MLFYLWMCDDAGSDGWAIADRLARAGLLVSPGDFYGDAGAPYARLALVQPRERLEPALDRLVKERLHERSRARGDDHEVVGGRRRLRVRAAAREAHDAVRAAIGALDRGEARVAEVIDDEVVVHEWAKQAVLLWFRLQELQNIEVGPVRVRRPVAV